MWAVGVITAGLTAYYMFRMLFVTFLGAYRGHVDPSELGLRHPELAGTAVAHAAQEDEHAHAHHAPAWLMSGPVALLMIPTVLIGWLDFGGDASPWGKFFAPVFGHFEPTASTPPEILTSLLVLVVIAAGITVAYMRYGNPSALLDAVPRLRAETVRMPVALSHAFYFDAAIDALFVKPSIVLGEFFSRVIDPRVIDAGVREASISAQWLGHFFRSFQTGLVRAYALALAFGAACFAIYYVVIGAGR
jgi:NAD(P)H-quinone oxidoreductase subunit 5